MKKRATRGVVLEVAEADVLLVAAEVGEAEERRVDDANEAVGAAAMLDVGPAGLADGGHVEAVAAVDEVLLGRAEDVSLLARSAPCARTGGGCRVPSDVL